TIRRSSVLASPISQFLGDPSQTRRLPTSRLRLILPSSSAVQTPQCNCHNVAPRSAPSVALNPLHHLPRSEPRWSSWRSRPHLLRKIRNPGVLQINRDTPKSLATKVSLGSA